MPWSENTTKLDLAYIAGIVDGEGSIFASWRYKNKSYNNHVKMTVGFGCNMTDRNVIDFIASKFILKVYESAGTKRRTYSLRIAGSKQLKLFLTPLLPYLIAKKHVAELALNVIETFGEKGIREVSQENIEKRQRYWQELRYSNHFDGGRKIHIYPSERILNN